MRRTLFVFALLMIPAVVIAAPAVYDQVWGDRVEERLCDLEEAVGIEAPECLPPTTTSSTTTTTVDTTTTTAPTTTTTQPPGLVIPDTLPYPTQGFPQAGGYDIMAWNAETGDRWWSAPYLGTNLPYHPGSAWIAGDRQSYNCGYGFIEDDDGSLDGRFAFVRPPGQSYGGVNDRYMSEAVRYLDGTFYTGPDTQEIPDEDCRDVLSDIDYDGACRDVDERPRVGFFDGQGNILDIRDYSNTNANIVWFNLFDFDGTRATVIACTDEGVAMIVYYDAMGDGQLAVDFNGTGPFG